MNPDLDTIAERLLVPLREVPDLAEVRDHIDTLQADGRWPDVDYANMDTTHWKPIDHLRKLLRMAQAWRTRESELFDDPALGDAIWRALDHWLEKDYRRPWWYNAIGIPGVLANIMLLVNADLTDTRRDLGCRILERAILGTTGQNLVWQANITVKRAILQRDVDLAAKAYDLIAAEIRISMDEGIQHDGSFHQHGDCLYNHGYGAGFARDGAQTAVLVHGTRFAFPQERIDILAGYILDGSQWMVRGQFPEIGAKGREITRRGLNCRYLVDAARDMVKVCPERASEFEALASSIEADAAPPVRGNRHYWRSDFMAHHRDGWYASARAHSTRMMNTDGLSGCDEGQKSHHISDGACFLYRTGREYLDIFPVWDWRKIPGTTVAQGSDFTGEPRRRGTTDFVGGVSDDTYGLFACDLEREASPLDQKPPPRRDEEPPPEPPEKPDLLRARKAWCFLDHEILAMGTGISSEGNDPVATTVNQAILAGPVTVGMADGRQTTVRSGRHELTDVAWVHHDETAYVFPEPGPVHLEIGPRTGSWKRIALQASDEPVTHDVFTLWLDHGVSPVNATYTWIVIPGVEASEVAALDGLGQLSILSNTPHLQAVQHGDRGILAAAFYEAGSLETPGGLVLSVDHPCLALLRPHEGRWCLTLCDPTNRPAAINVTIRPGSSESPGPHPPPAPVDLQVILPDGPRAGSSVTTPVS